MEEERANPLRPPERDAQRERSATNQGESGLEEARVNNLKSHLTALFNGERAARKAQLDDIQARLTDKQAGERHKQLVDEITVQFPFITHSSLFSHIYSR